MKRLSHWLLSGIIPSIGLLMSILIATDLWALVRGPDEWRWHLAPTPPLDRLVLFIATGLLFLLGWGYGYHWLTTHTRRRHIGVALALLGGGAILLQTSLLGLSRQSPSAILYERLISNQASGYFTVMEEIEDLPTVLRQYPAHMPNFSPDAHPRSKPPGIVLTYFGVRWVLAQLPSVADSWGEWGRGLRCADLWLVSLPNASLATPAIVGWLTIFVSTLAILPAFALGYQYKENPLDGWLMAGLIVLMPSRLLFTPQLDTIYPFLTLLMLYLATRTSLKEPSLLSFYLAGLVLSVATFFSPVNSMMGLVIAIFLLFKAYQQFGTGLIQPLLKPAIMLFVGSMTIWFIYWLWFGVTPLAILEAANLSRHDLSRSYWLWIPGNAYDFAIFVGLPAFLLALPWLGRRNLSPRHGNPLTLAFWLVLLGLLLSGALRAEVGRIWLMLAPFVIIIAGQQQADIELPANSSRQRVNLLLVGSSLCLMLAMGARWQVTKLEWPAPANPPLTTQLPPSATPLGTPFNHEIELAGYNLTSNDQLNLTLYWQTTSPPQQSYTTFIHILDEQNQLVAQKDSIPQNGLLPTPCWRA
ncbi:MAG TPA: hypothetical protein VLL52_13745, partial [Anaerolineae bacterium]|nr:hypothetical protein [Anaerolineae bacterium]